MCAYVRTFTLHNRATYLLPFLPPSTVDNFREIKACLCLPPRLLFKFSPCLLTSVAQLIPPLPLPLFVWK